VIDRRRAPLRPPPAPTPVAALALATAARLTQETIAAAHAAPDPWAATDGWRVGGAYHRALDWLDGDTARTVHVARTEGGWTFEEAATAASASAASAPASAAAASSAASAQATAPAGAQAFAWQGKGARVRIQLGGRDYTADVLLEGGSAYVFLDGATHVLVRNDPLAHAGEEAGDHAGDMSAPMPGKIIAIHVAAGDKVEKGQPLLVMEAMKMEHTITAGTDGEVTEIFHAIGDQVSEGAVLIALA
jgi:3-methylcrotonyl-CoA carboxylase alpha subunit